MSSKNVSLTSGSALSKYGLVWLTGERDPYAMRILFDLTEEGKALVCDFLGLPRNAEFDRNWNDGAVASVMLSKSTIKDLMLYILFHVEHMAAVMETQGGYYGFHRDNVEEYLNEEKQRRDLKFNPNPTQNNFNIHQFSGRT